MITAAFVVVPYLLLAAVLGGIWRSTRNPFFLRPLLVAFATGAEFGIVADLVNLSSDSPTAAAVGLVFLPFWMVVVAAVGGMVTALFQGGARLLLSRRMGPRRAEKAGAALAAIMLAAGAFLWFRSQDETRETASAKAVRVASSPSLSAQEVPRLLGRVRETGDLDLLLALTSNPAMPEEGTANIYLAAERAPNGDPRKVRVLRALAENSHTAEPYLRALSREEDSATREAALDALQRRGIH